MVVMTINMFKVTRSLRLLYQKLGKNFCFVKYGKLLIYCQGIVFK